MIYNQLIYLLSMPAGSMTVELLEMLVQSKFE
jgi:hypothetical protein